MVLNTKITFIFILAATLSILATLKFEKFDIEKSQCPNLTTLSFEERNFSFKQKIYLDH